MPLLATTSDPGRQCDATAMEVRCLNPLESAEWDKLVAVHPRATIFHSAAWARVVSRTYGHEPVCFAVYQEGRLAALIPMIEVRSAISGKRGVCVPFADYCAPLLMDGADSGLVFEALNPQAASRGWKHWEIRGGEPPQAAAAPSESYYTHSLDLRGGPEKILDEVDGSVRRAIRKAERNGLTTAIRSDREAILAYYRLHVRTRRRHGLPPQPLAFFLNIHEEIIHTGLGSVVLAFRDSKPVAGAVFFHLGRQALYKFGACDERLQDLRPNNLTMWSGIQFLARGGFETLGFGRTAIAHEGLRRYKLGWGATESTVQYYRFDSRSSSWLYRPDKLSGWHQSLFSRLPLVINRFLGGLIYPHLD